MGVISLVSFLVEVKSSSFSVSGVSIAPFRFSLILWIYVFLLKLSRDDFGANIHRLWQYIMKCYPMLSSL